jgi:hypothetical protein
MKTCFLITAYCDTDVKINSMKDTILRIKEYGHDVILYNHYPTPTDVQSLVNFSIFDKSNPVIYDMSHRAMIFWTRIINTPYRITRIMPDYGFAVAQQWARSIPFVYNMGYERVYVINYDTKFSNEFFNKVNSHLETEQCFAIEYGNDSMYLAFFAANLTDEFVERFTKIDINHYMDNVGTYIAEGYLYSIVSDFIIKLFPFSDFSESDTTTDITIAVIDKVYKSTEYSATAGLEKFIFGNDTPNYDKIVVLFYDVNIDLNFVCEYDGVSILNTSIRNGNTYTYIQLPINKSDIDFSKLKFIINDIENSMLVYYAEHVTIEVRNQ